MGEAVFTERGSLLTTFIVFEDRTGVRCVHYVCYLQITSNIMCRLSDLDTFSQLDYRAKQGHMSVTAYYSSCHGGGGGGQTIAAKSHDEKDKT